jgi:hypothetical protein
MGFLDFLFDKEKAEQRKMAKLKKTLTNMYVQPSERSYIIAQLRDMASPDAIHVLLARYSENAPNTTVDLEEKEFVYDVLVTLGRETDIGVEEIVKQHLRDTDERVNWPMRVLADILEYDDYIAFMIELLGSQGTEYQRDPEKKQEILIRALEFKSAELAEAIVPFLDDANDTIRFAAVDAAFAQEAPEVTLGPLVDHLVAEDSLRNVKESCSNFAEHTDYVVPEDRRDEVAEVLPDEYGIHKDGYIYEKRG